MSLLVTRFSFRFLRTLLWVSNNYLVQSKFKKNKCVITQRNHEKLVKRLNLPYWIVVSDRYRWLYDIPVTVSYVSTTQKEYKPGQLPQNVRMRIRMPIRMPSRMLIRMLIRILVLIIVVRLILTLTRSLHRLARPLPRVLSAPFPTASDAQGPGVLVFVLVLFSPGPPPHPT